jgi:hypothetical protein
MADDKHDTPIDQRYPWVTVPEKADEFVLPDMPTDRDFAKFYATIVARYQTQRADTIAVLKEISGHMGKSPPMPFWAKTHTAFIVFYGFSLLYIAWKLHELHAFG